MACSAEDVATLVSRELATIADIAVREGLRARLIAPTQHLRNWDYGEAGKQFTCWTIAEDPVSDTALVYSECGFGPEAPWGLVFISRPWFGMDSGWFVRLEDAFVESALAGALPIWDVVAYATDGGSRTVAESLNFDAAFSKRDDLALGDERTRYHVLYRSRLPNGIP